MIEFHSDNIEDLEEEARNNAIELSVAIVTSVCNGLDKGADVITLGFMKNLNLDINIHRKDYPEVLATNLWRVEKAEEFELCQRAVKWIEQLNSEEV